MTSLGNKVLTCQKCFKLISNVRRRQGILVPLSSCGRQKQSYYGTSDKTKFETVPQNSHCHSPHRSHTDTDQHLYYKKISYIHHMHVHNHRDLFPSSTIEQHTEKSWIFSVGSRSTENYSGNKFKCRGTII